MNLHIPICLIHGGIGFILCAVLLIGGAYLFHRSAARKERAIQRAEQSVKAMGKSPQNN